MINRSAPRIGDMPRAGSVGFTARTTQFITFGDANRSASADRRYGRAGSVGFTARLPNSSPSAMRIDPLRGSAICRALVPWVSPHGYPIHHLRRCESIRSADRRYAARWFRGFHRTATQFITFGDANRSAPRIGDMPRAGSVMGFTGTATQFITFGDANRSASVDRRYAMRGFRGFHRTATKFITFGDANRSAPRIGICRAISVGFTARLPNSSPSVMRIEPLR